MRDFFTKVTNFAKSHPVTLSALAFAGIAGLAVNAWGPTRELFTIEKPATYVTFNSITNNPNVGDERDFVGIRAKDSADRTWHNNMKIQSGKEYYVRMYVHNNAATNLNLVAENVVGKLNIPNNTAKSITVDGLISSSNAKPAQVWDNATFTGDQDFNLTYVQGSALFENNAVGKNGGVRLPDSIVTNTGATLGYDKLDGRIPGCNQYAGYVTVLVRANAPQPVSKIDISKTVRKIGGEKVWSETVDAKSGDTVEFMIDAKNSGASTINNLVIRDILPNGLEYIKGSAKLYNANNQFKGAQIDDTVVTNSGANVGAYTAGSNAVVRLRAKVAENAKLPKCGDHLLTNLAQASDQKITMNDTASVKVNKTCTPPPVPEPEPKKPIFECTTLVVKKIKWKSGISKDQNDGKPFGSITYQAEAGFKVENTKITGIRYVVKTSNGTVIADKTIGANEKFNFDIDMYKTEKYTVTATVITEAGEHTSTNCTQTVEHKHEEPRKPTPIVTCDNIQVIKISRTRFTINVNYTVTNIQFTGIRLVIRDSNGKIVQDKTSNGGKFTIDITTSGKYTIEVIVNGKNDAKCSKEIIVEDEPKVDTPAISIVKTVNNVKKLVTPENRDFNYEITVSNTGNVDLKDVKITDRAPENIKFFSADKGQIKDNVLTYTIPTLKVGATETITIKSQAFKVGTFKNIACVDTPTIPGDNDGCDSANVEVPPKENPTPEPQPTPTPTPAPTPAPTPNVPAELPRTGANFSAVLAIFSLTTAIGYYIVSLKR